MKSGINDLMSYEGIEGDKLVLRDRLAIDRTKLAAERTMLAYFRTGLTLSIAGITINKFFPELYYQIAAWIFTVCGIIVILYSVFRFKKNN